MDDFVCPPCPVPRNYLTQERAALLLGQRPPTGEDADRWDRLGCELFGSVRKMVYGLAAKYAWAFPDQTVDDLANSCFQRIQQKIGLFDPERGRFTTWVYRVSQSVLNKMYRSRERFTGVFCEAGADVDAAAPEEVTAGISELEIAELVLQLIRAFPNQVRIVEAMFGSPEGPAFSIPNHLNMADVARRTGTEYNEVRHFYCHEVRPRVLTWLKEMSGGQSL